MLAAVGVGSLGLAFLLALYGVATSTIGARKRKPLLVESARTSAYSLLALVAIANLAMLAALVGNDFSLRYVAENSSRATPLFFKVLSLWSADEGSLLLWNLVLAGYVVAVAYRFRRSRPETFPWALATMYGVAAFYLLLVLGPTTPFATISPSPTDGPGPLPLLQNHPLMAAHPPALYLGFIGLTVPFAFGIAALITGRQSDRWIRITRRWTLFAWTCLTLGLILGGLWSYGVLGWGGYWAWDPVENVALLPWLTATAFLHSIMAEERRGMLKVWNLSLIVATFALTILGTLLTRGSILSSVHAFAQSVVGPLYLAFLLVVLIGGFGLIAARARLLSSEASFETPASREAAFLGNNLFLLGLTFTVLLGTISPLIVEAVNGARVSVGGPYFRQTTVPVALLLIFLMGIGPLLPWRAGSGAYLARRLRLPALFGAVTLISLALAGMSNIAALLAFALAAFAGAGNVAELIRVVRGYRSAFGGSLLAGTLGAARRNRRLFGGLVVHLGVVLAAVGITASSSFNRQTEMTLARGESARFAGYELRYEGIARMEEPQRNVIVAELTLEQDGQTVGRLIPSVNYYPSARDPIGTPSIRVGNPANFFTDLYASVRTIDDGGNRASFRLFLNPGVMWLWIGGAAIFAGGTLAGWPARRVHVAARIAPRPTSRASQEAEAQP